MGNRKGFTLVEMMITVALIAILAAIAIPVYQNYVTTGKRTEAKTNLESLRLLEEQYYSDHGAYTNDLTKLKGFKPGAKTYFTYTLATPTATTFTATATEKEAGLGTYTINQDNGRTGPESW